MPCQSALTAAPAAHSKQTSVLPNALLRCGCPQVPLIMVTEQLRKKLQRDELGGCRGPGCAGVGVWMGVGVGVEY